MYRVKAIASYSTLLILLLLLPFSVSADSYLDELEKEAVRSSKIIKKPKISKTKLEKLEQFTEMLKFERPATYKFFTKLSLEKKNQVLKTYSEDKKLSAASKKIFDLYFEK